MRSPNLEIRGISDTMYNVKLTRVIHFIVGASYKKYMKEIVLPIPPFPGLLIDNVSIDHITVETVSDLVTCHMSPVDVNGDEMVFNYYCDAQVNAGWTRV